MRFKPGDRVRVVTANAEYTGCRGTVVPGPVGQNPPASPLGYYVAIDAENGIARLFLSPELEPLRLARVCAGGQADARRREA